MSVFASEGNSRESKSLRPFRLFLGLLIAGATCAGCSVFGDVKGERQAGIQASPLETVDVLLVSRVRYTTRDDAISKSKAQALESMSKATVASLKTSLSAALGREGVVHRVIDGLSSPDLPKDSRASHIIVVVPTLATLSGPSSVTYCEVSIYGGQARSLLWKGKVGLGGGSVLLRTLDEQRGAFAGDTVAALLSVSTRK